jgi:tRNA 2-thiouridine synthesizing protein E
MSSFELNGKTYETDDDGYLLNLDEWNEDVALYLAKTEDVEMSDGQWDVVNFLREYYAQYQIAPMIKILTKALAEKKGVDKRAASKMLYELFPAGPAKQACKIAGLPKPTGCV